MSRQRFLGLQAPTKAAGEPEFLPLSGRQLGAMEWGIDLVLGEPVAITGTVTDTSGAPFAGVDILLLDGVAPGPALGYAEGQGVDGQFHVARSSASGAFSLGNLSAGNRAIRLMDPGTLNFRDVEVVAPGRYDFVLDRGPQKDAVKAVGIVADAIGKPLPGVIVVVEIEGDRGTGLPWYSRRFETDDKGQFSLEGVLLRADTILRFLFKGVNSRRLKCAEFPSGGVITIDPTCDLKLRCDPHGLEKIRVLDGGGAALDIEYKSAGVTFGERVVPGTRLIDGIVVSVPQSAVTLECSYVGGRTVRFGLALDWENTVTLTL